MGEGWIDPTLPDILERRQADRPRKAGQCQSVGALAPASSMLYWQRQQQAWSANSSQSEPLRGAGGTQSLQFDVQVGQFVAGAAGLRLAPCLPKMLPVCVLPSSPPSRSSPSSASSWSLPHPTRHGQPLHAARAAVVPCLPASAPSTACTPTAPCARMHPQRFTLFHMCCVPLCSCWRSCWLDSSTSCGACLQASWCRTQSCLR